ncbi:MAG: geranylgeranyl reductase family protein [Promethearchaeota archaeon]
MYDVVISGAGPAGSKCAEIIAKAGYKVALIERDSNWRKPCGGAVSSKVFKYYPQLRKLDYSPIFGMTLYSADYHQLKYSWKNIRDYSINVDRLLFDKFIRDIAVDSGAELFDKNISFDYIYRNKKRVGIKTKTSSGTEEYYGKIIVIADGMSSKLAIKSGLRKKWNINEIGIVKCAILEGENNLDKENMSIFFRPYKGYAWIFPLDDTRFNIGCGTWQEENLNYNVNYLYSKFIKDPFLKNFLPHTNFKTIWEAAYPVPAMGVKEKCLYEDNLMSIGDAAGFVSPISGEGIHPSIVSGNAAAETAINALESENISKETLKHYKSYPNIKKIIRNFKMKTSMVKFFFENGGKNLSNMLELAEQNDNFREQVINMFLFNQIPSKDFLLKLKTNK